VRRHLLVLKLFDLDFGKESAERRTFRSLPLDAAVVAAGAAFRQFAELPRTLFGGLDSALWDDLDRRFASRLAARAVRACIFAWGSVRSRRKRDWSSPPFQSSAAATSIHSHPYLILPSVLASQVKGQVCPSST